MPASDSSPNTNEPALTSNKAKQGNKQKVAVRGGIVRRDAWLLGKDDSGRKPHEALALFYRAGCTEFNTSSLRFPQHSCGMAHDMCAHAVKNRPYFSNSLSANTIFS